MALCEVRCQAVLPTERNLELSSSMIVYGVNKKYALPVITLRKQNVISTAPQGR